MTESHETVDCTEEEKALIERVHKLIGELPKAQQLQLLWGWSEIGVVELGGGDGVLSVHFTVFGLERLGESIDAMEAFHKAVRELNKLGDKRDGDEKPLPVVDAESFMAGGGQLH